MSLTSVTDVRPSQEASIRFADTQSSVLLDVVRGAAALLVLLDHWRTLWFVDYGQVQAHRLIVAPLYILAASGHQSVMIFFVLSGYLIGGSVLRSLANDTWTWKAYLTHRLVRLWVVLLPALLVGLIYDRWGLRLNLAPLLYSGVQHARQVPDVRNALSTATLFGNALFLQTIKVPPLGSNGPLWSLANEFWYYILFPLGSLMVLRKTPARMRIFYALSLLATTYLVGWDILMGFVIWLLGALLSQVRPPKAGAAARWVAAGLYIPFVMALSKINLGHERASDYVLGAATFGLLWILLSAQKAAAAGNVWVMAARLSARFSFTLYLTHEPLLALSASICQGDGRYQPTLRWIALASAILVATLLYAWLVASATEFRTDRIRAWVCGGYRVRRA